MKFINENFFKGSLENFQKSLSSRKIYVSHLEKSSIVIVILL